MGWVDVSLFILLGVGVQVKPVAGQCNITLGFEDGRIKDSQLTATSSYGSYTPDQVRLNVGNGWGAYSSSYSHLQVDLLTQHHVTRYSVQGIKKGWYSKTMALFYSQDMLEWKRYVSDDWLIQGNTDADTVMTFDLNPPVEARYLVFQPVSWYGRYGGLRLELYGCEVEPPNTVSPTLVNQDIEDIQEWIPSLSPYVINSKITIRPLGQVNIQPDVKVIFNSSDAGLEIFGKMESKGLSGLPVVFKSSQLRTDKTKLWQGLTVTEQGKLNLSHCVINGADVGIKGPLTSISVRNCHLSYNRIGLDFSRGDTDKDRIQIQNSQITNNEYGIVSRVWPIDSNFISITNSSLLSNTDTGLYFESKAVLSVENSIISKSKYGIYVKRYYALDFDMKNCTIRETTYGGIYIQGRYAKVKHMRMDNCSFIDNSADTISLYLKNPSENASVVVSDCTFINTHKTIYLYVDYLYRDLEVRFLNNTFVSHTSSSTGPMHLAMSYIKSDYNILMLGNTFIGTQGVKVDGSSYLTINVTDNTFSNISGTAALAITEGASNILDNTFSNISGTFAVALGEGTANVLDNLFLNCSATSIKISSPQSRINRNVFMNPEADVDVLVDSEFENDVILDAKNNFWGGIDKLYVRSRVCDFFCDIGKKMANIHPFYLSGGLTKTSTDVDSDRFFYDSPDTLGGILTESVTIGPDRYLHVNRSLFVPENMVLTVEGNVTLDFSYKQGIYVRGRLYINGQEGGNVTLTSKRANTETYLEWGGLYFNSTGSHLKNVVLNNSINAVNIKTNDSGSFTLENCTFVKTTNGVVGSLWGNVSLVMNRVLIDQSSKPISFLQLSRSNFTIVINNSEIVGRSLIRSNMDGSVNVYIRGSMFRGSSLFRIDACYSTVNLDIQNTTFTSNSDYALNIKGIPRAYFIRNISTIGYGAVATFEPCVGDPHNTRYIDVQDSIFNISGYDNAVYIWRRSYYSNGGRCIMSFTGNTFVARNNYYGLQLYDGYSYGRYDTSLCDFKVSNNSFRETGIQLAGSLTNISIDGNHFNVAENAFNADIRSRKSCFTSYTRNTVIGGSVTLSSERMTDIFDVRHNIFDGSTLILKNLNTSVHENTFYNDQGYDIRVDISAEENKIINCTLNYWNSTDVKHINSRIYDASFNRAQPDVMFIPFYRDPELSDPYYPVHEFIASDGTIGGRVGGSVTLTGSGSPYTVTDNIVVGKLESLTIEAGVTLLFPEGFGIIVKGTFKVMGNKSHPVEGKPLVTGEKWAGVKLRGHLYRGEIDDEERIRLVGGNDERVGIVEVNVNGTWGTICGDYSFDSDDAAVVCRTLGFDPYGDNTVSYSRETSESTSPKHMRGLECTGHESSIFDCPADGMDCRYKRDIRINCLGEALSFPREVGNEVELRSFHLDDTENGLDLSGNVTVMEDVVSNYSKNYGILIRIGPRGNLPYNMSGIIAAHNGKSGVNTLLDDDLVDYPKDLNVTMKGCYLSHNTHNGLRIHQKINISLKDCVLERNKWHAIDHQSVGKLHVSKSVFARNEEGVFRKYYDRGYGGLVVVIEDSKIMDHRSRYDIFQYAPERSYDTQVYIRRNLIQGNMGHLFEFILYSSDGNHAIKLVNNTIIDNKCSISSFYPSSGSTVFTFDAFDNRIVNNTSPNFREALFEFSYRQNSNRTYINIHRNTFERNISPQLIHLQDVRKLEDNTTIIDNIFRDNKCSETIKTTVFNITIKDNIFSNPLSRCELEAPTFERWYSIDARWNYWGKHDVQDVHNRVCGFDLNVNRAYVTYIPYYTSQDLSFTSEEEPDDFWIPNLYGGVVKGSIQLDKSRSPIHISRSIFIRSTGSLYIANGVELRFEKDTGIYVDGVLHAEGSTERITMVPVSNSSWHGITFPFKTASVSKTVRLVNGSRASEGRVELFVNGSWSTVCSLDQHSAFLVCRALGYGSQSVQIISDTKSFGPGTGPIIESLGCEKQMTSLSKCQMASSSNRYCDHDDDDGVICNMFVAHTGPQTNSYMAGVSVVRSKEGILVQTPTMKLSNCLVNNTLNVGLTMDYDGLDLDLNGTVVEYSQSDGIVLELAKHVRIHNGTSRYNRGNGVIVKTPGSKATIENMFIKNNTKCGVAITGSRHDRVDRFHVKGTVFEDHVGSCSALYVGLTFWYKGESMIIEGNTFNRNLAGSIDMPLGSYNYRAGWLYIQRNHFMASGYISLVVPSSIETYIEGNIAENSTGGNDCFLKVDVKNYRDQTVSLSTNTFKTTHGLCVVKLINDKAEFNGSFNYNQIHGSTMKTAPILLDTIYFTFHNNILDNPEADYELSVQRTGSEVIKAEHNWWGTSDPAIAATRILHKNWDQRLLEVDYLPILTEQKFDCSGVQNCSNRGECVRPNGCRCESGWAGAECLQYDCSDVGGCNGNGECVGPNKCLCTSGWEGQACAAAICDEVNDCGGDTRGYCILPNICTCFPQFSGSDCSQCAAQTWGPSCLPCPRCVHGTCNAVDGQCECLSDNWSGSLCDQCSDAYYGPYCLPYINVLSIIPSSGPDTGNTTVHIRGHNFPETDSGGFYCRFDETVVNGTRISSEHIICVTPQHTKGGITVEISPDNMEFTRNQTKFSYYAECPASACGKTLSPPHGHCLYGGCVCVLPWTGRDCDVQLFPPVISPLLENFNVVEGDEFQLQMNRTQGSEPITWSLSWGPSGMEIDPRTGTIYWERTVARIGPYNITVASSNQVGRSEVSFLLTVPLSYSVIIDEVSPTGTLPSPKSVQIKGHIEFIGSSTIIAFVDIKVRNNDKISVISLVTSSNTPGKFEAIYFPKVGDSGIFEVDGRHPSDSSFSAQTSWRVLGMKCIPGYASRQAYLDTDTVELKQVTLLENSGADTLRNISAFVEGLGGPLTAAQFRVGDTTSTSRSGHLIEELGPGMSVPIDLILTATRQLRGTIGIIVNTTLGTTARMRVYVTLSVRKPVLTTSVSQLRDSVPRGTQKTFQVNITNDGEVPATSLRVTLPQEPRLALSAFSSPTGQSNEDGLDLKPGETAILVMTVTIGTQEALGEFSGKIALNSDLASADIRYRFYVTSLTKLNVTVQVEDEYTYFASDKPLVAGATVTLRNNLRGYYERMYTTNNTDYLVFEDVHEDRYTLQASAPGHASYSAVIIAKPSETSFSIFLQRVAVTYTWTVTPTTFQDKYVITLDSTFETNVPMPVVTVEPANINMIPYEEGKKDVINFNITNHGLISADNVRFVIPTNHPTLTFTQTIEPIGAVEANTSLIVPVQVKLKTRRKRNLVRIACGLKMMYDYFCGETRTGGQDITLSKQYPGRPPLPCARFEGGGEGGESIERIRRRGGYVGVWDIEGTQSNPSSSVIEYNPITPLTCDCAKTLIKECLLPFIPCGHCVVAVVDAFEAAADGSFWDIVTAARNFWDSCFKCSAKRLCVWCSIIKCIGNVYVDCIAPNLRRRRETSSEVVQGVIDSNMAMSNYMNMMKDIYGGEDMFNVYDNSWQNPFKLALADDSVGGRSLTQSEITAITAPLNVTFVPIVRKFLVRWNNTLTAWDAGTLTTLGPDDDVIPHDAIMTRSKQFKKDTEDSKQRGFGSIYEEFDNSVAVYRENEKQAKADDGVCAKVRVRIVQELVLTRDAFNARLEIENGELSALESIQVTVRIRATYGDGTYTNDKFSIGKPQLVGITAVDGTGKLSQDMSGSAEWLIIPYSTAAVREDTLYDVGGTLSYIVAGSEFSISLLPDTITVKPNPSLNLHYFHEKYVQGDDPLTLDVKEPVVPFSLAVMVSNGAYGVARQLKITSAQPEIIENEKGLLVSFKIIGAQLGSNPVTPSLSIDFGDIESFETKTARWLLTSSLKGRFYNFTATFENINPLGDPQLSIMDELEYHELVHLVRLETDSSDDLDDFLVNDIVDAEDLPDAVYDSSDGFYLSKVVTATVQKFTLIESEIVGSRTYKHVQLDLDVHSDTQSIFFYARLDNQVTRDSISESILRVTRDDGKEILVDKNAWQTSHYDDAFYFHIFDEIKDLNTSTKVSYSLVFGPRNMYQPKLTKTVYELPLLSVQTPGPVYTFQATDIDPESSLVYSLSNTSYFFIVPETGQLRSVQVLQAKRYEFKVIVTDDGVPPKQDEANVIVIVSDDGTLTSTTKSSYTSTTSPSTSISISSTSSSSRFTIIFDSSTTPSSRSSVNPPSSTTPSSRSSVNPPSSTTPSSRSSVNPPSSTTPSSRSSVNPPSSTTPSSRSSVNPHSSTIFSKVSTTSSDSIKTASTVPTSQVTSETSGFSNTSSTGPNISSNSSPSSMSSTSSPNSFKSTSNSFGDVSSTSSNASSSETTTSEGQTTVKTSGADKISFGICILACLLVASFGI